MTPQPIKMRVHICNPCYDYLVRNPRIPIAELKTQFCWSCKSAFEVAYLRSNIEKKPRA